MAGSEHTPDWERIEHDYRAGILSLREIAGAHGLSHTAINKRAKRDGWERDLSARIQAKADALVSRQAVSSEVSTERGITERVVIEANAQRIAQVRGEHRADISRARALGLSLFGELEHVTGGVELFKQLGELMLSPDDKGIDKLSEAYHKVISLTGRVGNFKALSEALKNLVGLEREAYDIGAGKQEAQPSDSAPINITEAARQIALAMHIGLQRAQQEAKAKTLPMVHEVPASQAHP